MNGRWGLVALVVLLLALSAFFVAAEFALIAARRTIIEPRAVTSSRARTTLRAMEDISVMLACAQLGITVCGVLLGALGEPVVAAVLEPLFGRLGVGSSALQPVSLMVALLLVVSAHVALGEMVPKNVALADPENIAILLAPPLRALTLFLGPVVRGLNHLANAVVRLIGREPLNEVVSVFTRDELAGLVAESRSEGLIDRQEHDLITSALEFETATIDRVLLADADVVALHSGVTAAEVEQACARTGFSRFPIRDDDGKFVGYLHIRDVIDLPPELRDEPVPAARIRPLPVVVAGTELRLALDRMRRLGAHLAQVVGPHPVPELVQVDDPVVALAALVMPPSGPPVEPLPEARLGLVTLEDVIEELIGEVRDSTRRRPLLGAPGQPPSPPNPRRFTDAPRREA